MNLILFTESRQCEKRRQMGRCGRCRSDVLWRKSLTTVFTLPNNNINFACPHGVPWVGEVPTETAAPRKTTMAGKVLQAGASIAKTQLLRLDRTNDAQYQARLAVCRSCPSLRMVNGSERCGPMYESWIQQGGKTCGCILKYKARDTRQTCPQGKWPDLTKEI